MANIRAMPGRIVKPAFSAFLYRQRNAVERFFNKLKHFRAVATRYDKRDDNFLASIQLASIRIWLRFIESVTLDTNVACRIKDAGSRKTPNPYRDPSGSAKASRSKA
jgi:hypothetical protein